jgi:hypothetical protein
VTSPLEAIRAKVEEVRKWHNISHGADGKSICDGDWSCEALKGWEAVGRMAELLLETSCGCYARAHGHRPERLDCDLADAERLLADIAEGVK